jgi:hypothetical protein
LLSASPRPAQDRSPLAPRRELLTLLESRLVKGASKRLALVDRTETRTGLQRPPTIRSAHRGEWMRRFPTPLLRAAGWSAIVLALRLPRELTHPFRVRFSRA